MPLDSAEHFYVVTDQVEGVDPDLPILRDPDGYIYFKEEVGGLVVGGFEPEAKPWVSLDQVPYPFEFAVARRGLGPLRVADGQRPAPHPGARETGIRKFYNGPESFMPDNQFLMGQAPGSAASSWARLQLRRHRVRGRRGPGAGRVGGRGRADQRTWSPSTSAGSPRSTPSRRGCATGSVEILGLHYAVPWPNRELESARPQRLSPLYDRLAARNACFGSKMGWERANVFAPPGEEPVLDYTWGKPSWLPWSAAEQRATRSSVAVFDQTSFSKYLVTGRDAEASLQWICTNDVAVPVGTVVYTGMLNRRGTYEADLTVTRVAEHEFLLVSGSATTERDQDWIRRNIPAGHDTAVADVTPSYAVLGVMGPRSRELLARVSGDPLGDPFATSRWSGSPGPTCGPLGSPTSESSAGSCTSRRTPRPPCTTSSWRPPHLGVVDAGYYAIESLRLEKGYRAFGRELTPDFGPVEAGLLFACKLRGDVDFLGRGAVEATKAQGPSRRLVSFVVADPGPMLWGGELVLRDGVAGRPGHQRRVGRRGRRLGGAGVRRRPGRRDVARLGDVRVLRRERRRLGPPGDRRPPRAVRPGQRPRPRVTAPRTTLVELVQRWLSMSKPPRHRADGFEARSARTSTSGAQVRNDLGPTPAPGERVRSTARPTLVELVETTPRPCGWFRGSLRSHLNQRGDTCGTISAPRRLLASEFVPQLAPRWLSLSKPTRGPCGWFRGSLRSHLNQRGAQGQVAVTACLARNASAVSATSGQPWSMTRELPVRRSR